MTRITMWHKVTGASAETSEAAYDAVWKPIGWRKSPPEKKTRAPSTEGASSSADSADSADKE